MGEAILEHRSNGYRRKMMGSDWITITRTIPPDTTTWIDLATPLIAGKTYQFHVFVDDDYTLQYDYTSGTSHFCLSYSQSGTASLYGTIIDVWNAAPISHDAVLRAGPANVALPSYNRLHVDNNSSAAFKILIQYKQLN